MSLTPSKMVGGINVTNVKQLWIHQEKRYGRKNEKNLPINKEELFSFKKYQI
jgi:hypothetical protein